jgi:hypothetical protein
MGSIRMPGATDIILIADIELPSSHLELKFSSLQNRAFTGSWERGYGQLARAPRLRPLS